MSHRTARIAINASKLAGCMSMFLLYLQWLQSSPSLTADDYELWPPPLPPPHRRLNHLTALADLSPYVHLYNSSSSMRSSSLTPVQFTNFTCPRTQTDPSFYICVYETDKDIYISASLLSKTAIWEPYHTPLFQKALRIHPNAVVIDIGANLGYYGLLAVTMGHPVIAIEPGLDNILRLHQGLLMNSFNNKDITIVHNAVYDKHINVSLTTSQDNQGGLWITKPKKKDSPLLQTIVLDDIVPLVMSHEVIVKIDIEGFECRALSHAEQLFTKFHVPFVFMEWRKMFINMHSHKTPCSAQRVQALVSMLSSRGYIPYEVHTGFQLDPDRASSNWRIGDVYWRHHTAEHIQESY